ncbi:hypothetical protein ACFWOL_20215 [Streptomyces sp. NPDC058442]|uniref:hypothetical protein n=1 Tax=Streptomyces sp. NPDC058442 TaxID=3346503 RepID=UPI003657FD89
MDFTAWVRARAFAQHASYRRPENDVTIAIMSRTSSPRPPRHPAPPPRQRIQVAYTEDLPGERRSSGTPARV